MSVKALARRRKTARSNNSNMRTAWNDLYRYVLPYRRPSSNSKSGTKTDQIFDSTAPKAAFRFAGRMEQEVTPPFQEFFELKTGPLFPALSKDQKKATDEALESVMKLCQGVLQGSNFSLSMSEMYLDLFGGTGALLMMKDEDAVMDFTAVPFTEIDIREDGRGRVVGIYWEKKYPVEDLQTLWQTVRLPKEIKEKAEDESSDEELSETEDTEEDEETKERNKKNFITFVQCKYEKNM